MLIALPILTSSAAAAVSGAATMGCVSAEVSSKTLIPLPQWSQAEQTVKAVFGGVGVQIKWEAIAQQGPEAHCFPVRIQIDPEAPPKANFEALALAFPYRSGGTQIHVYMDRVLRYEAAMRGTILGYTLAHEIGHMLEGICWHSDEGVMKAKWTGKDFSRMRKGLLGFFPADTELMEVRLSEHTTISPLQ